MHRNKIMARNIWFSMADLMSLASFVGCDEEALEIVSQEAINSNPEQFGSFRYRWDNHVINAFIYVSGRHCVLGLNRISFLLAGFKVILRYNKFL
jgi:TATA-box binding protein (TBP) (component of TFIID and TFIIIB)